MSSILQQLRLWADFRCDPNHLSSELHRKGDELAENVLDAFQECLQKPNDPGFNIPREYIESVCGICLLLAQQLRRDLDLNHILYKDTKVVTAIKNRSIEDLEDAVNETLALFWEVDAQFTRRKSTMLNHKKVIFKDINLEHEHRKERVHEVFRALTVPSRGRSELRELATEWAADNMTALVRKNPTEKRLNEMCQRVINASELWYAVNLSQPGGYLSGVDVLAHKEAKEQMRLTQVSKFVCIQIVQSLIGFVLGVKAIRDVNLPHAPILTETLTKLEFFCNRILSCETTISDLRRRRTAWIQRQEEELAASRNQKRRRSTFYTVDEIEIADEIAAELAQADPIDDIIFYSHLDQS